MKRALMSLCLLLSSSAFAESADPTFFVSANVGAFKNFTAFYNSFQFDYGGKVAVSAATLGSFADLWPALAVNGTVSNTAGLSNTEVMVQPLFMNVASTALFFAPQVGFNFISLGVNTDNEFSYGALVGYTIPIDDSIYFAPEANLTVFDNFGEMQTALKLLAGLNFVF
jgi:hypothetical protein